MKAKFFRILLVTIIWRGALFGANSQPTANTIPLVRFTDVPLADTLEKLTRQAGGNFVFDPKLSDTNSPTATVKVTGIWKNISAEQLLEQLLNEHGLMMVTNPVTTVTRITFTNEPPRTVEASLLGIDTNQPIPLVQMVDVPLGATINYILKDSYLNVILDPKLTGNALPIDGEFFQAPSVSIRWENITARQALVALCENYDLKMGKDGTNGAIHINPMH